MTLLLALLSVAHANEAPVKLLRAPHLVPLRLGPEVGLVAKGRMELSEEEGREGEEGEEGERGGRDLSAGPFVSVSQKRWQVMGMAGVTASEQGVGGRALVQVQRLWGRVPGE